MTRAEDVTRKESTALRAQCEALEKEIEQLQVLQRISQDLVSEVDIDLLLHDILRSAIEVMKASAGALMLLDEPTDELVFRVVEGGGGERLEGKRMSRHQGIGGWVLDNQEVLIVDDTQQDQRFYAELPKSVDYTVDSMICAPMTIHGEPVGVLQILNKQSGDRFHGSDKELLRAFAAQSAIVIRNAALYQELREERDKLVAVEEDIRKELARDLHDGPIQVVAAIPMNIEFIRKLLEREPDKVPSELGEVDKLADRAVRQLRTMMFELRPVILETQGLIPALDVYSNRLTETERFAVHLDVEGEVPRLTKQAGSAVFAVVQEAIINVKKHTQAKNIWIRVECNNDTLNVSVHDDGQGFDVSKMQTNYESRGSLGMINMYERAEMIRGVFSIDSASGQGTTVRIVAPLETNAQPAQPGQG
jgi:signal transduction histidine kinase